MNSSSKKIKTFRIGVVNFFNALPLIYGLEDYPQISEIISLPPSKLAEMLDNDLVDAALAPTADYKEASGRWDILPPAAICSNGPVLTVQVFSDVEPAKISRLLCDSHSHTSIVMAKLLWKMHYQRDLQLIDLSGPSEIPASLPEDTGVLLIGDKVLGYLDRWKYNVDLGEMWTKITGTPFVYAVWAVKSGCKSRLSPLAKILAEACKNGMDNIEAIIVESAQNHGFEHEIARKYLRENICYNLGSDEESGMKLFFEKVDYFKGGRQIDASTT